MNLRGILISLLGAAVVCGCYAAAQQEIPTETKNAGSKDVLFFDDFDEPFIDTTNWVAGTNQWGGPNNNGVVPENLRVLKVVDPASGKSIGVLDAQAHGDLYQGPVPGVQKVHAGFEPGNRLAYASPGSFGNGYVRTGGVVWTKLRFGPAKYEIRMRALQKPGGETAIWNFYDPPTQDPGAGTYTEIDVEIPANGSQGDMHVAGLNSYATAAGAVPSDKTIVCNCLPVTMPNQADGKFHWYEIDWHDGSDGTAPRIDWYVDGALRQTSTKDIPVDPAQLWVGNWPAKWSAEGKWDYAVQNQYVDTVKISKLEGNRYPTTALPAPTDLKIATKSSTSVDLVWREAAESRDVAGYRVLANGIEIDQTPSTHIELTGLSPRDSYSFTVEAINTAMMASAPSAAVGAQLPASAGLCTANPTSPIIEVKATTGKTETRDVDLKWDVPVVGTRDGILGGTYCSIVGYEVSRSDGNTWLSAAHQFNDLQVTPGRHRYDVTPYNQFGVGPTTSVWVVVP